MSFDRVSATLSLLVAITVLAASYRQWWNISYNGGMKTKRWVKVLFAILLSILIVALTLLLMPQYDTVRIITGTGAILENIEGSGEEVLRPNDSKY